MGEGFLTMKKGKATLALDIKRLKLEAAAFVRRTSGKNDAALFGVTDGKAVGTYVEHKFQDFLSGKYQYTKGSSAEGLDFPELKVDIKVTSLRQPQSSCPFKSARQKIYGLGYSLLVFVYEKEDDALNRTGCLRIKHTVFVEESRTADFQTTSGLRAIIENSANRDDILAFFSERMLPADDIQAQILADEVIKRPPEIGYLTISNALQWRLQYSRVIQQAGKIAGIDEL
jgi:hypothetical protein